MRDSPSLTQTMGTQPLLLEKEAGVALQEEKKESFSAKRPRGGWWGKVNSTSEFAQNNTGKKNTNLFFFKIFVKLVINVLSPRRCPRIFIFIFFYQNYK